mmetsp:Transcript_50383/g.133829  ORF Transcript_50383/g.133829 Transcript_50383/m.133829 type:complete len:205 (+) Transcript_50383:1411-2025(+)
MHQQRRYGKQTDGQLPVLVFLFHFVHIPEEQDTLGGILRQEVHSLLCWVQDLLVSHTHQLLQAQRSEVGATQPISSVMVQEVVPVGVAWGRVLEEATNALVRDVLHRYRYCPARPALQKQNEEQEDECNAESNQTRFLHLWSMVCPDVAALEEDRVEGQFVVEGHAQPHDGDAHRALRGDTRSAHGHQLLFRALYQLRICLNLH